VVGAAVGVSTRAYSQDGRDKGSYLVPIARGDLGIEVAVSPTVGAMLIGSARADLSTTLVHLNNSDGIALSPWEGEGRLALRLWIP
jgi:hypothetical protein